MPFSDAMNTFNIFDICKIDDDNTFTFHDIKEEERGFAFVKFKVPKTLNTESLYTFSANQKDWKQENYEGNTGFSNAGYTS